MCLHGSHVGRGNVPSEDGAWQLKLSRSWLIFPKISLIYVLLMPKEEQWPSHSKPHWHNKCNWVSVRHLKPAKCRKKWAFPTGPITGWHVQSVRWIFGYLDITDYFYCSSFFPPTLRNVFCFFFNKGTAGTCGARPAGNGPRIHKRRELKPALDQKKKRKERKKEKKTTHGALAKAPHARNKCNECSREMFVVRQM